ncbi:hypothetical protein [Pseudomonas aeruginosa]|uniref:hypothetical protein n=1 Tax=Pseudomonas aeruginosa TaxID=287 RepID=UPI0023594CBF|nr:hypothetical protein [Pseudomonas aeruginosa]MDC8986213.1 hypothetical protein [Pseudomonas aeruginosa]
MSAENNNSAMTTNQNHPDDHLLMFQDEAYALGRAQGRLDVFRFDLHLERQRRFSERTFGPGASSTTSARSCARSMKPLATWPSGSTL